MTPPPLLPDDAALARGLASLLDDGVPVTLLRRESNVHESSFPTEIVTCRVGQGPVLRLLCKYESGIRRGRHGHWGGVIYEAEVYGRLLASLNLSTPRFYGAYVKDGLSGLIIEYLDGSLRVSHAPEPSRAMAQAAGWLGRFHSVAAERLPASDATFLRRYDAAYYRSWSDRASDLLARSSEDFPGFGALRARYEDLADLLAGAATTVIHGEFYPSNVLWQHGAIRPVDWESAAVAAGAVDLAFLTEGWPPEIAQDCEREYLRCCPQADFDLLPDAARLYLHFRWFGSSMGWKRRDRALYRFETMRRIGERRGWL